DFEEPDESDIYSSHIGKEDWIKYLREKEYKDLVTIMSELTHQEKFKESLDIILAKYEDVGEDHLGTDYQKRFQNLPLEVRLDCEKFEILTLEIIKEATEDVDVEGSLLRRIGGSYSDNIKGDVTKAIKLICGYYIARRESEIIREKKSKEESKLKTSNFYTGLAGWLLLPVSALTFTYFGKKEEVDLGMYIAGTNIFSALSIDGLYKMITQYYKHNKFKKEQIELNKRITELANKDTTRGSISKIGESFYQNE
ncbi:MAG: hypothetical protein Q8N63_05325, partial [Nanoarchaeota archaeon]|nr:hypothetical protein [Nanoarchaeota archaeon]